MVTREEVEMWSEGKQIWRPVKSGTYMSSTLQFWVICWEEILDTVATNRKGAVTMWDDGYVNSLDYLNHFSMYTKAFKVLCTLNIKGLEFHLSQGNKGRRPGARSKDRQPLCKSKEQLDLLAFLNKVSQVGRQGNGMKHSCVISSKRKPVSSEELW